MACGDKKPAEGTEEVGSSDKYLGTGSINHAGVGNLIKGSDTGGYYLWVVDMGYDPLHGMVSGEIT